MKRASSLWVVGAICLLAVALRLTQLTSTGIYADEGTHFAITQSLLAGDWHYLAIQDSTTLFAKGPLFPAVLALWWRLGGADGSGLAVLFLSRFLGVVLQLLNVALLNTVVRRAGASAAMAALAALLLALSARALALAPYALSYQLAAVLVLFFWFAWGEYRRSRVARRQRRWLMLAAGALGLALLTDLVVWTLLPGFLYLVGRRRARDLLRALVVALAPSIAFLLLSELLSPEATRFDLAALWTRMTGSSLVGQLALLRGNILALFRESIWLPVSLLGALALPRRFWAEAFWFFAIPLLALARSVALTGLASYHLIPWLPWLALGAALLIGRIMSVLPGAGDNVRRGWLKPAFLALAIGSWWLAPGGDTHATVSLPPGEARAVAEFLADSRAPHELVLATPAMAWLLPGAVADYQMALAAAGLPSAHFPTNLPQARFRFDSKFESARYAVVDRYLSRWALRQMPELLREVAIIEAEWERVFMTATMAVYWRPP